MVSETVQAAQSLLAERERVGLAKYGTTVDRTDLQAVDWLQHAIEEASDLLLYLIRLRGTIPRVTFHHAPGELDRYDDDRAAYLKRCEAAPEWAGGLAEAEGGDCIWLQTMPVTAREAEAEIQRVGGKAYKLTGSAAEQVAKALGVTPPSKLRPEVQS